MKAFFLLVIVLHLGQLAVAQPILYGNNPTAGHYQLVRGVRLYYETYGQGPPLPGYPGEAAPP